MNWITHLKSYNLVRSPAVHNYPTDTSFIIFHSLLVIFYYLNLNHTLFNVELNLKIKFDSFGRCELKELISRRAQQSNTSFTNK